MDGKPGDFRATLLLDFHWLRSAGLDLFILDLSFNDGARAREEKESMPVSVLLKGLARKQGADCFSGCGFADCN